MLGHFRNVFFPSVSLKSFFASEVRSWSVKSQTGAKAIGLFEILWRWDQNLINNKKKAFHCITKDEKKKDFIVAQLWSFLIKSCSNVIKVLSSEGFSLQTFGTRDLVIFKRDSDGAYFHLWSNKKQKILCLWPNSVIFDHTLLDIIGFQSEKLTSPERFHSVLHV